MVFNSLCPCVAAHALLVGSIVNKKKVPTNIRIKPTTWLETRVSLRNNTFAEKQSNTTNYSEYNYTNFKL